MLKEYLSTLANKFREVIGETEPINAQDFADKIQYVYEVGYGNGSNYGYEQGKGEGYEQGKAEGVTEGKPLGKIELLQDSEYMNAKVSGTAIAVNDVNAIEHSVGCYLTSDTITDFSGIAVSRYGKNLFRPQFNFIFVEASYTDGTLFTPQISGNTLVCTTNPLYVPQNTWLYYKHALLLGKDRIVIRIYNSNDENISTTEKTDIICSSAWYLAAYKGYIVDKPASGFSFKVTSNVAYITLCYCGMDSEGGNKYGDLQLELGTTATPYEPYIEPTVHTANADGTVDGIKSISPNMTLLTNNNNVVINANYLRDIDTYIDNLKTNVALSGGEA